MGEAWRRGGDCGEKDGMSAIAREKKCNIISPSSEKVREIKAGKIKRHILFMINVSNKEKTLFVADL